jgi:hypothetical protein
LYLCVGDIDLESITNASAKCASTSAEVPKGVAKGAQKVKDLPPALLAQMSLPTAAPVSEKRVTASFRTLRKNIQANLNSFNTTRKTNTAKPVNHSTRKLKPYTNAKILSQFTSF